MPDIHSMTSASSAYRWMQCTPSARLCAELPDIVTDCAAEGTCAHALCEYKLKHLIGIPAENPVEDLDFYNAEMEECASEYAAFVEQLLQEAKAHCKDPVVLIEQRLDFSDYVPNGFGTGDCVIVSDDILQVIDYKHGQGVLVDAEHNPQMMLYALGALNLFDHLYDIDTVQMTIFQPRRENVSTWTISKDDLIKWAEEELKPVAELAARGEGEFKAGDHCRFCKVKATCRERAMYNLELARYDFAPAETLNDTEIEAILAKVDGLVSWANDIKEYALKQALAGKEYADWKIVEGRSNRKYASEAKVAEVVKKAGFDPYEQKVLGITAMTKLLGKEKFDALLAPLVIKPAGKPTLVPRTDKKPSMKSSAQNDFED